jgi:hypothetical protein
MRYPLVRAPRAYEDYYSGQAGGAIPVFVGGRHRGRGLGSILGGIGRSVIPLLKRGGKELLKQGLSSGMKIAQDVIGGRNVKEAFKHRAREAGGEMFSRVFKAPSPAPPGRPRHKRIKPRSRSKTPQTKRNRKRRNNSDIFG